LFDIIVQDKVIESLIASFPNSRIVDRRDNPSHGYRAVHIIPVILNKPIEIQVRTALQHKWSEISEKLADLYDPAIKYGGGPQNMQETLLKMSNLISIIENLEKTDLSGRTIKDSKEISDDKLREIKIKLEEMLNMIIANFENRGE